MNNACWPLRQYCQEEAQGRYRRDYELIYDQNVVAAIRAMKVDIDDMAVMVDILHQTVRALALASQAATTWADEAERKQQETMRTPCADS